MGYSVTVSAAELLMSTLYQHLFAGDDLAVAIRHARTELYNNKERRAYFDQKIDLEDWLLPVVYQNQPVTLQPREFTSEERAAWFEHKAEEKRYTPPRSATMALSVETSISSRSRNACSPNATSCWYVAWVVQAKPRSCSHLAAWWHTTGFVQRVFYFGYDEKAWTLQQIMTSIAQASVRPEVLHRFPAALPAAQQAMLSQGPARQQPPA